MMTNEFEARLAEYAGAGNERPFTDDDYSKIEYVYTWHPAIKAVGGKEQIAIIWQEFGMGTIKDMYPAAQEMEALETKRDAIRRDLNDIEKDIKAIKDSYR